MIGHDSPQRNARSSEFCRQLCSIERQEIQGRHDSEVLLVKGSSICDAGMQPCSVTGTVTSYYLSNISGVLIKMSLSDLRR